MIAIENLNYSIFSNYLLSDCQFVSRPFFPKVDSIDEPKPNKRLTEIDLESKGLKPRTNQQRLVKTFFVNF